VVTGALGLLGKYHCRALADAGASVVVCDLDDDECWAFAEELSTYSIGVGTDVTRPGAVRTMLEATLLEFEHVHVLVNNAAINDTFETPALAAEQSKFSSSRNARGGLPNPPLAAGFDNPAGANRDLLKFEHYPLSMWQKSLAVNVTGVFLCAQVVGTQMARQEEGSIINVASTYGIVAPDQTLYRAPDGEQTFFKSPAYPTTKGAVIAFTRYLAAYWGRAGVRVNALSPGGVENGQADYFIANYASRTPLGRMAQPTDYEGALIFLASDASRYMTGANLVVDGGWTVC
jgi:NAD(P)-dependent dehydrogenase (short-subunit alcohol dehydrogenase family)